MGIATYFEKLRKKVSDVTYSEGVIHVRTENGRAVPAEILDISEYGCSFELQDQSHADLPRSRTVRIQWENLGEGINSTVVERNGDTGFIVVRFEKMSKEQYVQLLEFIMERKSAAFKAYGFKVS